MTPEGAVRAQLLATVAVTALVSQRVYLDVSPQGISTKHVVVRLVDDPHDHHLRGPENTTRARVSVEACIYEGSTTRPDMDALVAAISAAIDGQRFTQSGRMVTACLFIDRRPLYDAAELRLMRMVNDYYVWSKAA